MRRLRFFYLDGVDEQSILDSFLDVEFPEIKEKDLVSVNIKKQEGINKIKIEFVYWEYSEPLKDNIQEIQLT
jgi:hypothetical protein